MIQSEVVDRVRTNLDDAGITFYEREDIADSVQDGYDEIVALNRPLSGLTTLTLQPNKTYYNLYTSIVDFISLLGIYNTVNQIWLTHKPITYFKQLRRDWELSVGNPIYFSVLSFEYIAIFPRPTIELVDALEIYYVKKAARLDPNSVLDGLQSNDNLVEFYSTADLLEQADEFTKSGLVLKDYFTGIKEHRRMLENRHLPDRIYELKQQIPAGGIGDASSVPR